MKKTVTLSLALALLLQLSAAAGQQEARLLRFPTVGGDKIVFCYAGNLYSVGIDGGTAVKLTSHVGYESFPRISPDGKTIAFTGQYDGNTEVYTMPIDGGEPVRQHNFSGLRGRLCKISVDGGLPEVIPTTEGGFCSYSPDGSRLAMNRMFREFRTWKYYRGGQADDIWINTVGTTELTKITDNDAQDIFPMWIGDEIYYLSDRDRTMNLFVYDTVSGQTEKVTDFSEYDCKFPSNSDRYIVFENGGKSEKVTIYLPDDDIYSRSEYRSGMVGRIGSADLSPDGSRVIMEIRGDIFSLPAEQGPVYNLTRSPGSHEREAVWSPDGERIAWLSDADGEYQVYVAPYSDLSEARKLTSFKSGYPSRLQWSPDSRSLFFNTDDRKLYRLDAGSGRLECLLTGEVGGISSFTVSSDGSWAAYTTQLDNRMSALYLYDLGARKSYQVTDRWYDASSPVFSTDGKYLFFTSMTEFRPVYSSVEWNTSYNVAGRLFVLPLAEDTPNPVLAKSDEYSPAEEPEAVSEDGKDRKSAGKEKPAEKSLMKVDTDGMALRIASLPVGTGYVRAIAEVAHALSHGIHRRLQEGSRPL